MKGSLYSKHRIARGSLVFLILAGPAVQAVGVSATGPRVIEVFTVSDRPVTGRAVVPAGSAHPSPRLQVYELDGLRHIEAKLSRGLPPDPEQSRHMALQHIQQLDETDRTRMQQAAVGLARAVHYGIDRYPAIVFDGQAAVYGLTHLAAALRYYRVWRAGNPP